MSPDASTPDAVNKDEAAAGPMGQRFLAGTDTLAMRLWDRQQPGEAETPVARDYETVGYVVSGRVELTVGTTVLNLGPGDSWSVPRGAEHSYRVLEELTAVEATSPPARPAPEPGAAEQDLQRWTPPLGCAPWTSWSSRPTFEQYAFTFGGAAPVLRVRPGTALRLWSDDAFAGRCAPRRTCRARRSTCATSTRRPGRSTSRAPSPATRSPCTWSTSSRRATGAPPRTSRSSAA